MKFLAKIAQDAEMVAFIVGKIRTEIAQLPQDDLTTEAEQVITSTGVSVSFLRRAIELNTMLQMCEVWATRILNLDFGGAKEPEDRMMELAAAVVSIETLRAWGAIYKGVEGWKDEWSV